MVGVGLRAQFVYWALGSSREHDDPGQINGSR